MDGMLQMAAPPAAGEAAQALGGAKVRRRPQNAVPTRTCAAKDCKVQPSYNYPGEKKRLFCSAHRAQGKCCTPVWECCCAAVACF